MLKTWQKLVSLQIIFSVIENLDLSVMYIVQLALICLRGSNNSGSYRVSGCLYLCYTCHHALWFQDLNSFSDSNLKSGFSGVGEELNNGSFIMN